MKNGAGELHFELGFIDVLVNQSFEWEEEKLE